MLHGGVVSIVFSTYNDGEILGTDADQFESDDK
jgi:hypothetical protein